MNKILEYPNTYLNIPTKPISIEDIHSDTFSQIGASMLDILYKSKGIGLSANQVGLPFKMCVIHIPPSQPMILLNPRVVEHSNEIVLSYEGCLSVPGYFGHVKRYKEVVVEYETVTGKTENIKAQDKLCMCLQHEIDHLEGKLFIEYAPEWKLINIKKKIEIHKRKYRSAVA